MSLAVEDEGTCNGCGACCYRIILGTGGPDHDAQRADFESMAEGPDPRLDENWLAWKSVGWGVLPSDRDTAIYRWLTGNFLRDHWTPAGHDDDGDAQWACDAFDLETRRCMAYEDRPPICSGYPWYGETPTDMVAKALPDACSYREAAPSVRVHLRRQAALSAP